MSDFKMTRKHGVIVAIVNFLVRKYKVGNFIFQIDVGQPARLGVGAYDYWARGYTDTNLYVSCDFLLEWEDVKLANAKVAFRSANCNNDCPSISQKLECGYSEEGGVFIKS